MTFIHVVFVITGRYSPVSTPIRSLRTRFHALDTFFDIKTRELLVLINIRGIFPFILSNISRKIE